MDQITETTFCIPGKGLSKDAIHVRWSKEYFMKPHPTLHDSIESAWAEKAKQNIRLFNGLKFRLHDVQTERSEDSLLPVITLLLGTTSYKEFIGTNCASYASQLVTDGLKDYGTPHIYMANPLGVGAILETKEKDLIFMRRSNICAEMQGMIDRPGGHPEPDDVEKQSNQSLELVDPSKITDEIFDSVLKEIRDEINISKNCLSFPVLLGISYNPYTFMRPSLEFFVRCEMMTKEVQRVYSEQTQVEAEESTELIIKPLSEVLNFANVQSSEFYNELTPAAKSALLLLNIFYANEIS